MGNGNPKADPGAQNRLSLLHRAEYLVEGATRVLDQVVRELSYDAGLVARGEGNDDPVWREKLSQEHSAARGDISQSYIACRSGAICYCC